MPVDASLPALLGGTPVRPEGPPSWPPRDPAVREALAACYQDGSWGRYRGPRVAELKAALQAAFGVPHVVPCCSGRAAVALALKGAGVQPGDDVLLAAYDFQANFAAVHAVGAFPVLVDVRADDAQLDVSLLDAAVTPRTRAVLASHLHGGMVDLPALKDWATDRRLAVVEDACQAEGATLAGRPAGTWGDVGVISFGGSKLLSAGRGGAILTAQDIVFQRIKREVHAENETFPLSELQAAVLLPQLERLPERHAARTRFVAHLTAAWKGHAGLERLAVSPSADPAFYKVGFFYDPAAFGGLSRERLCAAMRAEGFALDPGFPALHRIHAARRFRTAGELPQADRAHHHLVKLHHPWLLSPPEESPAFVTALEKIRHHADLLQNAPLPSLDVTDD